MDLHSTIKAFHGYRVDTGLVCPDATPQSRRPSFVLVDGSAALASIEPELRRSAKGLEQFCSLKPCEGVGPDTAGGPLKQELIHSITWALATPCARLSQRKYGQIFKTLTPSADAMKKHDGGM